MAVEPVLSYATLFGFLFTLARVSAVFAFVPLAGLRAAPEPGRIFFSLAITLMLRSQWRTPIATEVSIIRLLAGASAEVALGLAIGIALAVVFEVFQMGAQAVSLQAGLGYASTIDPTSGADSTVLTTLAQLTAGMLFFVSGADRLLVRALADSLRIAPPDVLRLNDASAMVLAKFAGLIFSAGLRLAMPLIALLLLADISLAVLGRIQPQIHLIGLTMPLKLGATMLILSATMVLQPGFFQSLMKSWSDLVYAILRNSH